MNRKTTQILLIALSAVWLLGMIFRWVPFHTISVLIFITALALICILDTKGMNEGVWELIRNYRDNMNITTSIRINSYMLSCSMSFFLILFSFYIKTHLFWLIPLIAVTSVLTASLMAWLGVMFLKRVTNVFGPKEASEEIMMTRKAFGPLIHDKVFFWAFEPTSEELKTHPWMLSYHYSSFVLPVVAIMVAVVICL